MRVFGGILGETLNHHRSVFDERLIGRRNTIYFDICRKQRTEMQTASVYIVSVYLFVIMFEDQ